MGQKVTSVKTAFVSFKPCRDGRFTAFLSLEGLATLKGDPELLLQNAAKVYEKLTNKLRSIIADINRCRSIRRPIPARMVWEAGEQIYKLKEALEKMSLEVDGLYEHLSRDLGVRRKWLEKVIIFRRYLPKKSLIPVALNWGKCEKGTRKVAEKLLEGLPLA